MEKWWKSHKQQLEEKLEEKRLKSAPQVHSTHVLRRIPKYPKTVAAVVVCMLLFAILLSVSVGAAVPFLAKVNWSRVGRIGAIILLVIILLVTFWKLEKSRKWIGGAVALTAVLVLGIWGIPKSFRYFSNSSTASRITYTVVPDPNTRTFDLLVTSKGSDTVSIPRYYAADWDTERKVSFDVITFPTFEDGSRITSYGKDAPDDTPRIHGPNKAVTFRTHESEPVHIRVCIHQRGIPCPDFGNRG